MTTATAAESSRVRYAVMAMVFSAAFITYLDRVCISVAAPLMQADLGLSQLQFGWVFTVFYLAYTIFEIPSAWLGDRWGQRRTLVRIVSGWSIFTVLTGAVVQFSGLLVTRFLFGAAEAGAFPTLSRVLSRWFPVYERSRANGLLWMGARSGGALSPAIAVILINTIGWRWTFAAFGGVGVVWVVICRRWYTDDPAAHPAVRSGELALLSSTGRPAPAPAERVPWRRLLGERNLLLLFGTYFCSGFGFQFFVTWLPTYLIKEYGLSLTRSGFYSALPLAGGAVGCLLGGVLADFVTRRRGLVWGRRTVGCGGFLLAAIAFGAAIVRSSPAVAVVCLVLASASHDMTLPVLWATCTDAGGKFGGTSSGFVNFASCISGVTAPLVAAELAHGFGSFRSVFYVTAALYVMGGILWLFIDPRRSVEA